MAHPDELVGLTYLNSKPTRDFRRRFWTVYGKSRPGDAGSLVRPGRGRTQSSWWTVPREVTIAEAISVRPNGARS